MNQDKSHTI